MVRARFLPQARRTRHADRALAPRPAGAPAQERRDRGARQQVGAHRWAVLAGERRLLRRGYRDELKSTGAAPRRGPRGLRAGRNRWPNSRPAACKPESVNGPRRPRRLRGARRAYLHLGREHAPRPDTLTWTGRQNASVVEASASSATFDPCPAGSSVVGASASSATFDPCPAGVFCSRGLGVKRNVRSLPGWGLASVRGRWCRRMMGFEGEADQAKRRARGRGRRRLHAFVRPSPHPRPCRDLGSVAAVSRR